jgi:ATP-dependent RNA helicase DeaD
MTTPCAFNQLGLNPQLLPQLAKLGYEQATPVQAQSIPILLAGEDLIAQAQTGTGKTAAFALPALSLIDPDASEVQVLIMTPTRELALQVSEACKSYAKAFAGFRVLPIYGGQGYRDQLKQLERGCHMVVGTPGRLLDHLQRGSLKIDQLKMIVLDEADEMLKMGFIEDIETILAHIKCPHQTALFSATLPPRIKQIAKRYQQNAKKVHIAPKETTVSSISQSYTQVLPHEKLEALTRYLEVESTDAAIIFTRTKTASNELAEKLQARGYLASALNGDMDQTARQKVVSRMKQNKLDIIVATDVAARGIDIERISHVINYDIPFDSEAYIHRIGRTGRAGRQGKAWLLITPREKRFLREIEQATQVTLIKQPPLSGKVLQQKRELDLIAQINLDLEQAQTLKPFFNVVRQLCKQNDCDAHEVAAALVQHIIGKQTLAELGQNDKERSGKKRRGPKHPARARIERKQKSKKKSKKNRQSS